MAKRLADMTQDERDEAMLVMEKTIEFAGVVKKKCKEWGRTYEFKCPICGSIVKAARDSFNGHIHLKSTGENCPVHIIE